MNKVPCAEVVHGDCLEILQELEDNSIHALITDPPYGLSSHSLSEIVDCVTAWASGQIYQVKAKGGFMNKSWDSWVPGPEVWKECLRVLTPGAHMLVFAGARSMDLMSLAIRLAGFELRDTLMWVYAAGMPKGLNVSKQIDKKLGASRKVVGKGKGRTGERMQPNGGSPFSDDSYQWPGEFDITEPATDAAKKFEGWNSAIKPSYEPILLCRKPLEGNIMESCLKYGTGALNIDATRVEYRGATDARTFGGSWKTGKVANHVYQGGYAGKELPVSTKGRYPSNLLHDGSEEVVSLFPDSKGQQGDVKGTEPSRTGDENTVCYGQYSGRVPAPKRVESETSAARFFYCAKASKADREEGLGAEGGQRKNVHPTTKPTKLMRWLCRLITPVDGIILDPFVGSGSTGKAAVLEGFTFLGIEQSEEYVKIAEARINHALSQVEGNGEDG